MIHMIGPRNRVSGKTVINTTSRSADDWSRGLSPFYLGPVKLYGDYVAKNVEKEGSKMKRAWINITRMDYAPGRAESFIKILLDQFPTIKFKLGKKRVVHWGCSGPETIISVMALLPTPHPNDESALVVKYARSKNENRI